MDRIDFVTFAQETGLDKHSYEAKVAYADFLAATENDSEFSEWWADHQAEYV
jgi:hypothetical protein